ncbi:MAG: AraC family transcriptional regulator [Pseudomonadota bacterium]
MSLEKVSSGTERTMRDDRNRFQFSAHRRRAIEIPSANMRDSLGLLFDVDPLKTRQAKGLYRVSDWHHDRCIFSISDGDLFTIRRTKAQSRNGEPLVFVHRYLRGGLRGRSGDLNIDRHPGAIYVLDQACDVECVQDASLMQCLFLPKSAIGYDVDTHPTLIKIPTQAGLGRTLDGLFDQAFSGLLTDNSIEDTLIDRLAACLRVAIQTDAPTGDVRRHARDAIADQIRVYVEQRLEDWDLSVASVLRDFGASRASLYRMFDAYGGVRQYISHRRLLRAVMDISSRPVKRGRIANAAERWGYSSGANFNRAVRQEFGVPPGDLVNIPDFERENLALSKGLFRFRNRSVQSVDHLLEQYVRLHA